jgi:hypothetical protein
VERAVHRLELVFGIIQLHPLEHILGVKVVVPRRLPKVRTRDVGRVHERVASLEILVSHPIFQRFSNNSALGMKEDQSRASKFLDAE